MFHLCSSARDLFLEETKQYQAFVQHTGHVWWEPGGVYTMGCQMEITYYPFDDQKCNLNFSMWEYSGKQVMVSAITLFCIYLWISYSVPVMTLLECDWNGIFTHTHIEC